MFLQGSFGMISPAGLIQALCQEQRAARIEARHGGSSASVWLADGFVIAASCDGLDGPEAVYRLVGWPDGMFRVSVSPDDTPATMAASPEELLLEAARRRDEPAM